MDFFKDFHRSFGTENLIMLYAKDIFTKKDAVGMETGGSEVAKATSQY